MSFSRFLQIYLIFVLFSVFACGSPGEEEEIQSIDTTAFVKEVERIYGFPIDSFDVFQSTIGKNEFLSEILSRHNVDYQTIHNLAMASRDVFDVRKLVRGRKYTILSLKDSSEAGQIFIYEPNDIDFVVYDFRRDSIEISIGHKEILVTEKEARGEIKSSLYESLQKEDQNVMLAFEMADIFAWSIDFYRLQKGDQFHIIYNEESVDGKVIGIEKVSAVRFIHEGKDFYAYHFMQDSTGADYFDEAAESLRKAFLKSPLKFSRLTSGYTRRRFHPVQKRWKAHLGTDYAAPKGTPILATGDGKVVEARYKKYNGNYVKIRHNSIYMTQYLHMSKIASGVRPGTYVKQGEVIGYVGSTGLATGPHVCYRFWKHGSQVNHLKEDFPPSEPVREENIESFYEIMRKYQERLKPELKS